MRSITYTIEELLAHKNSGRVPVAAIENLRAKADQILDKPTLVASDIELPRPSGNIHDYTSMGPYWWPNPDTPDGLPWVRRDCQHNPVAMKAPRASAVHQRVHALALAELYIGGGKYAEYANRQLYDWFINPDTYIAPHARYAQSIPGICEGRGIGLIDFVEMQNLFNGIAILDYLGLMNKQTLSGVEAWFEKFADWILTHEYGLEADNGKNNHGSWHDAGLLSIAIFLNREALAKKICNTAYFMRFKKQINEEGAQPFELARVNAMGYSKMNLKALMIVANIAERLGYADYWGVDSVRGVCIIKSAVDYLKSVECEDIGRFYLSVDKRYSGEGYFELAMASIPDDSGIFLEPVL